MYCISSTLYIFEYKNLIRLKAFQQYFFHIKGPTFLELIVPDLFFSKPFAVRKIFLKNCVIEFFHAQVCTHQIKAPLRANCSICPYSIQEHGNILWRVLFHCTLDIFLSFFFLSFHLKVFTLFSTIDFYLQKEHFEFTKQKTFTLPEIFLPDYAFKISSNIQE